MNRVVNPGWVWLFLGLGMLGMQIEQGLSSGWRTLGGPMVYVGTIGGALLLTVVSVLKLHQNRGVRK